MRQHPQFMDQHTLQTGDPIFKAEVTVASNATLSSVLETNGYVPVAIRTPAALTSTTITFKAGMSGDALSVMADADGNALSITVAADKHIPLSPSDFAGVRHLQLVMGSAEAAGRTVVVVLRKLGAT